MTLDGRRDRVQRERPRVEREFSNPTSGHRKRNSSDLLTPKKSYRRRRYEEEPNERPPMTTRENGMNECFWIVSLIVLEVSPGDPPDVPSRTPRKPPKWARGPARARNRQILNRVCIEKYTDFDGRRIREFCPSRTRPDLDLFAGPGRDRFSGRISWRLRFENSFRRGHFPMDVS